MLEFNATVLKAGDPTTPTPIACEVRFKLRLVVEATLLKTSVSTPAPALALPVPLQSERVTLLAVVNVVPVFQVKFSMLLLTSEALKSPIATDESVMVKSTSRVARTESKPEPPSNEFVPVCAPTKVLIGQRLIVTSTRDHRGIKTGECEREVVIHRELSIFQGRFEPVAIQANRVAIQVACCGELRIVTAQGRHIHRRRYTGRVINNRRLNVTSSTHPHGGWQTSGYVGRGFQARIGDGYQAHGAGLLQHVDTATGEQQTAIVIGQRVVTLLIPTIEIIRVVLVRTGNVRPCDILKAPRLIQDA